jgi:hypothetical protein
VNARDCVKVLLFIASPLVVVTPSEAATITVSPLDSDERGRVTVIGTFENSDIEQFRTKTSLLSKALVAFASNGGSLNAGIEIGTMLRLKGFASFVPDGARCASACALAWLGGAKRLMGPTAQVGFHAAYIMRDGVPSESSAGNALVGAYLNRIGLDRAVTYLTQAAPQDMIWLNLGDAERLGIDVELFTPDQRGADVTAPVSSSASVPEPNPASPLQAPRAIECDLGDHRDRATGCKADVGRQRAQKQSATRRGGRATIKQIGDDSRTDIWRDRHLRSLTAHGADEHIARPPIYIIQGERRDFAGPHTEPRQHHEDGVVPPPQGSRSIATVENGLNLRGGEIGRQARELPAPDGGYAAGQSTRVQPLMMEVSEKRA